MNTSPEHLGYHPEMNPPPEKLSEGADRFAAVNSWEELIQVARQSGGLQGSRGFYPVEKLISQIEIARRVDSTKSPLLKYLTRTDGFRAKVLELIRREHPEENRE